MKRFKIVLHRLQLRSLVCVDCVHLRSMLVGQDVQLLGALVVTLAFRHARRWVQCQAQERVIFTAAH